MASNKGKTNAVGSFVPQVLDPRQVSCRFKVYLPIDNPYKIHAQL